MDKELKEAVEYLKHEVTVYENNKEINQRRNMEDVIKGIIYTLAFMYKTLELFMPFLIWHICNKVNEIERKMQK